ncbi:hypothetical protein [Streptomyces sp. NPDC052107]|uniref:hypothetical protein n=1 Tax=Streptomyces sp. NPDC052107 TaxID=3155632 RepID=UPI003419E0F7
MAPTVRTGVAVSVFPLFAQLVGVVVDVSQNFWFSSRSMSVVPDGTFCRRRDSSRNLGVVFVSV